jgi:hypothetical protein
MSFEIKPHTVEIPSNVAQAFLGPLFAPKLPVANQLAQAQRNQDIELLGNNRIGLLSHWRAFLS